MSGKIIWDGKFGDYTPIYNTENRFKTYNLETFESTISKLKNTHDELEDLILFFEKMTLLYLKGIIDYKELNSMTDKKWIKTDTLRSAVLYMHNTHPFILRARSLPGTTVITYSCYSESEMDKYAYQSNTDFCLNYFVENDKMEIVSYILKKAKKHALNQKRIITGPLIIKNIYLDDEYNNKQDKIAGEYQIILEES